MSNYRGSEWRKWDLHFHTPASYDYKDKSVTNEDIIEGLRLNAISVVAITDHHIIDVERIHELQKLGKDKGVTVLPGIEFLCEARGKEPIHFIGIFEENCNLQYVWEQVKNRTSIAKIEGEDKAPNAVYCDLLDTAKLVKELGGITTIHAGSKSNGIDNITNSLPHATAQKEDISSAIDVFELGKEDDIDGYTKIVNPYLIKKIGKELPLIICTDNHNIRDYKIKQNLWIKADPTFEGLRQIIFEPKQRVKIQSTQPDYKEDKLIIDEVSYFSSENTFRTAPIKLNQNLNVIIGGKSSGKSILLYYIAKTLETNDEVSSIAESKYGFEDREVFFDFEVKSRAGVSQKLKGVTGNSIIPNIKYIPQNYLSKLAEPESHKKGGELLSYVRGLLLEDESYKVIYDDFLDRVRSNDRQREESIDQYFLIKERIAEKVRNLKTQGSEEVLKKSVQSNTKRVADLKSGLGLSEEKIKLYNLKKEELEKLKIQHSEIINDFKEIRTFNRDFLKSAIDFQEGKKLIEKSTTNVHIKKEFVEFYEPLNALIKEIQAWLDLHSVEEGKFKKSHTISNLLDDIKTKKDNIQKELAPYIQDEKVKKEIADIEKVINADNEKIRFIQKLRKEIQSNRINLLNEKTKIFDNYLSNLNEYVQLVDALKERTLLPAEKNLQIEGSVKFNASKFKKSLQNVSDGRSFPEKGFAIFQERENLIHFDESTHLLQIQELFSSMVEKGEFVLSSKTNIKEATKILLDDYFIDYWETIYDGDTMNEMSTGKASFVILMLIIGLSSSKSPILIDQPEDNLDNRSITKDLVTYLRNKKLERQIILVTHNPNVVVNADSENIIVAHQKGQNDKETSSIYTFDYVNGAIENAKKYDPGESDLLKSMGIREHIADIVEGGKDAFKKREEKYGF